MFDLTKVEIKPAKAEDAVNRAEISKKAFDTDKDHGSPGPGGPPGYDSPEFHEYIMKIFECYNICYNKKIIGGLVVNTYGRDHCILEAIYIDPAYHRKGIASHAMEYLFTKYEDTQAWTLGTPEWNTRTHPFYLSVGFKQIGWHHCAPEFRCRWYEKQLNPNRGILPVKSLEKEMTCITVEGTLKALGETKTVPSSKESSSGRDFDQINRAVFEDSSGNIPLLLYNEKIDEVKVGEKLRIELGFVTAEGDILQLNASQHVYLIHLL